VTTVSFKRKIEIDAFKVILARTGGIQRTRGSVGALTLSFPRFLDPPETIVHAMRSANFFGKIRAITRCPRAESPLLPRASGIESARRGFALLLQFVWQPTPLMTRRI